MFDLVTTVINTEPLTTFDAKAQLKAKVYQFFTDSEASIAEQIRQRKLILPLSADVEIISDIMTDEFTACSPPDRADILNEFYTETEIYIIDLTLSYGNVYVKIRTRN
jgi:hypothetical protein